MSNAKGIDWYTFVCIHFVATFQRYLKVSLLPPTPLADLRSASVERWEAKETGQGEKTTWLTPTRYRNMLPQYFQHSLDPACLRLECTGPVTKLSLCLNFISKLGNRTGMLGDLLWYDLTEHTVLLLREELQDLTSLCWSRYILILQPTDLNLGELR